MLNIKEIERENKMKLNDTYNVHKKINSVFPFFKSKYLCKKGIHNYLINHEHRAIPHYDYYEDYDNNMMKARFIEYEHIYRTYLKCLCCGVETELDGEDGVWKSQNDNTL